MARHNRSIGPSGPDVLGYLLLFLLGLAVMGIWRLIAWLTAD